VPASEAEHYRHTGLSIETIPDEIAGISAVRNWVLRHFSEDAIVMLDDDISACVCMVSLRCRKLSVAETLAMLENSAWCARGAGAR
jgi:glycosyltransferase involved in cell wall biosynthesis